MRVLLATFGTTGDHQPFLALAVELQSHGHEVLIACSPQHSTRVRELGVRAFEIGQDFTDVQNSINAAWVSNTTEDQIQRLMQPLKDALPTVYQQIESICSDYDILIAGPALPVARAIHEKRGVPFVSVQVSNFGGTGSQSLRRLGQWLTNPFRRSLGLPDLNDPFTVDANSPQLALYAVSQHVCPRNPLWPEHYKITGFFFLEEPCRENPALAAFLADGEPPVSVTFGAMGQTDAAESLDIAIQAIEISQCRAVVQAPGGAAYTARDVLTTGYIPHGWLFARSACVVHHGGGGTAAAVFRAGKPSVYVPFGHVFDQPVWGKLSEALGCSRPAIPRPFLTAEGLAVEMRRTLDDSLLQLKAREIGRKVVAEGGVQLARKLIEKFANQIGIDW